jgi:hypothetical protein
VVNRVIEYFRPIAPAPELVADLRNLPAVGGAILYWESISDRAFKMGLRTLGLMASVLADEHPEAWARLKVEADWCCPSCGAPIAPDRN